MRAVWWVGVILAACGPTGQDLEHDDTTEFQPPDLAGAWEAWFTPLGGCEAHPEVDGSWIDGPLVISGPPEALTFDFGEGILVAGDVDASFTFVLDDAITVAGVDLILTGEGLAYSEHDLWALDGDVSLDWTDPVDPEASCSLTGTFEASQTP